MVGIERIRARNFDRESPNLIKGTWLLVIRGREVRNRGFRILSQYTTEKSKGTGKEKYL